MSLRTIAQGAFSTIQGLVPESVVEVVSGDETANGILDTVTAAADLSNLGEKGLTTGIVLVSSADLTEPERGATITIDGDPVFVVRTALDPAAALIEIEFSKQRPITTEGE